MLKWIGHTKGIEYTGLAPARDLTQDEVEALGGAEALIATGCYVYPDDPGYKPSTTKASKGPRENKQAAPADQLFHSEQGG